MKIDVTVTPEGTIRIPEDVRREFGLKDGDVLSMETEGAGKIVLKTHLQQVREVQEEYARLSAGHPPFTSDDLIRERREEAQREEQQFRRMYGD